MRSGIGCVVPPRALCIFAATSMIIKHDDDDLPDHKLIAATSIRLASNNHEQTLENSHLPLSILPPPYNKDTHVIATRIFEKPC